MNYKVKNTNGIQQKLCMYSIENSVIEACLDTLLKHSMYGDTGVFQCITAHKDLGQIYMITANTQNN